MKKGTNLPIALVDEVNPQVGMIGSLDENSCKKITFGACVLFDGSAAKSLDSRVRNQLREKWKVSGKF